MAAKTAKAVAALREYALGMPGAYEEFPWGERVAKVNKKVFVFLGHDESEEQGFSVKLPQSGEAVLSLPFAEPTGYGLGKSGWVSVHLTAGQMPPMDVMQGWIAESYRAVAPKTLVRQLDAPGERAPEQPAKRAAGKRRVKSGRRG